MRHCINETVDVYEASGESLATLLRDAADTVASHDGYSTLSVDYQTEEAEYIVTVYNHG